MRKFIHLDMDSFYASVEMRDNPQLKNIPIAVGGDAKKRGVIATANYIARQYGVHSAMSTAQALKKCPSLKVIPPRPAVYKAVSQQVHQILSRYTPLIEFVSLDEAYLDVTDVSILHGSGTLIAKKIREDIAKELNLTASAGIAPLKFLAKIASDMNKPNGQYVIDPDHVLEFIDDLPLSKIPGVGKVTTQRLNELGLFYGKDIKEYDLNKLLTQFGKMGSVLYERCQGIDPRMVNIDRERKSIGVERTLNEDINQWEECLDVIDLLYDELLIRLKKVRGDLKIARQGVKFKFDDFQSTGQEHVYSILDKQDLILLAKQVWDTKRLERSVRLVGLYVSLMDSQLAKQLEFKDL